MKIDEIVALHGKLAKRMKQFESNVETYPPLEVANEIRYALRAAMEIIEQLTGENEPNQNDLDHAMQKTNHALLCAYHDLVDGLVLDITATLKEIKDKYLEESIAVMGNRRQEIIDFINKVEDKTAESRESPRERKRIYDEVLYDQYFEQLIDYKKWLVGSVLEDVVRLAMKNKETRKREGRKFVISTVVAFLAVIVAVLQAFGVL